MIICVGIIESLLEKIFSKDHNVPEKQVGLLYLLELVGHTEEGLTQNDADYTKPTVFDLCRICIAGRLRRLRDPVLIGISLQLSNLIHHATLFKQTLPIHWWH